jgi:shikimate kinase
VTDSVFLVGFMGSGKSAVGRELAERLDWRFVDVDEEIVAETGCPVPELFEREGEAGFRKREASCLRKMLSGSHQVVACGGGIVTVQGNLTRLLATPGAVCLEVSPEEAWRRIGQDPNRPLLQGTDPEATLRRILAEREPLYAQFAIRIQTDGFRTSEVADQVLSELRKRG